MLMIHTDSQCGGSFLLQKYCGLNECRFCYPRRDRLHRGWINDHRLYERQHIEENIRR